VKEKEKYIPNEIDCGKKVVVDNNTKLHFVNRILTTKAFNKYCNKNINKCAPKINTNPAEVDKTKKNVINTLGKKNISFDANSFYSIAKTVSAYGVITQDNKLLIGKNAYSTGDMIGNYKITYINYKNGVVIIDGTKFSVKRQ
jgi:hypothetical protein